MRKQSWTQKQGVSSNTLLHLLAGLRDGNLQKISVWIIKSFNTVLWVATARRGWVDSFKYINICIVSADK